MSVAQTLNAGILEESATIRKDESVLLHIKGRDCVAIEARYHKRCYQMYTKVLTRTPKIKGPTLYDKAFDIFCKDVVEERIINRGEVLMLSYLLKKFISCVKSIEKIEVPYQAARLRKRIKDRFPHVVFHASRTMNKGTLVYSDAINVGDVADNLQENDGYDDDLAANTDTNMEVQSAIQKGMTTKDMFFAAMEIRKLLTECKGVDAKWPPDSHDLTSLLAQKSIPIRLYNFLSWSMGFSSEPVEDHRVKVNSSENAKIVSIAQDMVYAESKGRTQTFKYLALGMAVRQMTGSERLLRILHGLGHTASIATVHRHDTALALVSSYSVEKELPIPRNMSRKQFTTLVWDNNDFSEETISGKGTTHVANGIILQNASSGCTLEKKQLCQKRSAQLSLPKSILFHIIVKKRFLL